MLCLVLTGPDCETAACRLSSSCAAVQLAELRLDRFDAVSLPALRALIASSPLPLIATLRSPAHGGVERYGEADRLALLEQLALLPFAYLDVEWDVPAAFLQGLVLNGSTKLILSHHDFAGTPRDLSGLLAAMRRRRAGALYKIATTAHTPLEACRLLTWAAEQSSEVIAVAMGAAGHLSRICSGKAGIPFTYCSDGDEAVTRCQLDGNALSAIYRHGAIGTQTALYGLLGDPVDASPGHYVHNAFLRACGADAVYVKMHTPPATDLKALLQALAALGCRGLSVTIPHKEAMLEALDDVDTAAREAGAVNTLVMEQGRWRGYNTDGEGAVDALASAMPLRGAAIALLGAGGSAAAIAYSALRRGAVVTVLNRDEGRARRLAGRLGCRCLPLSAMEVCCRRGYDIIVNATPSPMPVAERHLLPGTLVMDISLRGMTPLLEAALRRGCRVIVGDDMYVRQAAAQQRLWHPHLDGLWIHNRVSAAMRQWRG